MMSDFHRKSSKFPPTFRPMKRRGRHRPRGASGYGCVRGVVDVRHRAGRPGNMSRMRRAKTGTLTALGLALIALAGCQTYVPSTGQTLPTGRYLEHPPQYIPPSPPFPLARELATMEAQAGAPVP